MISQQKRQGWIVQWTDDSGDEDHDTCEVAGSPEEAREIIERLLTITTITPDDAEEYGGDQTEPAYEVLARDIFGSEILAGLSALHEDIKQRCDDGTLTVRRTL